MKTELVRSFLKAARQKTKLRSEWSRFTMGSIRFPLAIDRFFLHGETFSPALESEWSQVTWCKESYSGFSNRSGLRPNMNKQHYKREPDFSVYELRLNKNKIALRAESSFWFYQNLPCEQWFLQRPAWRNHCSQGNQNYYSTSNYSNGYWIFVLYYCIFAHIINFVVL